MPRAATLEAIAQYGGAILVELTPAEQELGSPVRNAAIALSRYRQSAEAWAATKAQVLANTRFSDAGRRAEMGDAAARALSELGRHDTILARAQVERDELAEAARKVPLNLSAEQIALLPAVLAQIRDLDPLLHPELLAEAAANRDILVVAAFLFAPRGVLKLAVTEQQLDAARDTFAGGDADRGYLVGCASWSPPPKSPARP